MRELPARMRTACVYLVLTAAWGASAHGQEWTVDARGGLYPAEAGTAGGDAVGTSLGVRHHRPSLQVGAMMGVPIADSPLWAGVSITGGRWTRPQGWAWGLLGSGQLFGHRIAGVDEDGTPPAPTGPGRAPVFTSPPGPTSGGVQPARQGWGLLAEITPAFRMRKGDLDVGISAGITSYAARFADVRFDRTAVVARTQASFGAPDVRRLTAEAEVYRTPDEVYPRVGLRGVVPLSPAWIWAGVGAWLHPDLPTIPWQAGAALNVGGRSTVSMSVRRDGFDPILQTPARTAWTVGLSVRVGSAPRGPGVPRPRSYRAGIATIALPAAEAGSGAPRIAGDFNGWSPVPMSREGDAWVFHVALEPGLYRYAFVADDGTWFVPESLDGRRPDGFGGHTAVLVVDR